MYKHSFLWFRIILSHCAPALFLFSALHSLCCLLRVRMRTARRPLLLRSASCYCCWLVLDELDEESASGRVLVHFSNALRHNMADFSIKQCKLHCCIEWNSREWESELNCSLCYLLLLLLLLLHCSLCKWISCCCIALFALAFIARNRSSLIWLYARFLGTNKSMWILNRIFPRTQHCGQNIGSV